MVLFNRKKTDKRSQKLMGMLGAGGITSEIDLSYPLLLLAAQSGNLGFIQKWLDDGCNINERDEDGFSALHMAIISNIEDRELYNQTIEFLINKGIDVNIQDNEGETALHYAIELYDLPLMIKLLQHGAKGAAPAQCSLR
jgi:ankyrin repeat protein